MTPCTILIPTYNRPQFLRRLLTYLVEQQVRHIVIADGSHAEAAAENAALIAELGSSTIRHLRYPTEIFVFERLSRAVMEIDTPYLTLCADDDFVIPEAVGEAVAMLDADPRSAAVIGAAISFSLFGNGARGSFNRLQYDRTATTALHDDPGERILGFLCNYFPVTYSIRRTSMVRASLANVVADGWTAPSHASMAERWEGLLTVAQGKMLYLDRLTSLRQAIPGSGGNVYREQIQALCDVLFERRTDGIVDRAMALMGMDADDHALRTTIRYGLLRCFATSAACLAAPPSSAALSTSLARRFGIGARLEQLIKLGLRKRVTAAMTPADRRALATVERACKL